VFVKLVLSEPESAAVQQQLAQHALTSSQLLVAESRRAVARVGDAERLVRLSEELESVDLVEITGGIVDAAGRLTPSSLRTLDAIHLATALRVAGLDVFVCNDARLAQAATAMGLRVISPR
jgi:predicted nucleic acid-binding protein